MFSESRVDHTTVDDVAHAAGIGCRTFFRYYARRTTSPGGAFDEQLVRMRRWPPSPPSCRSRVSGGRCSSSTTWNRTSSSGTGAGLRLILQTPALQAHSTPGTRRGGRSSRTFVAERRGEPASELVPQSIGHASPGVCLAGLRAVAGR
ncbi:hypothetical protein HBB16_21340 [Pseudonocardia sp. MCCB 268]|nr:hypothetical protein [Pseudonocardia cytotoxica]